MIIGIYFFAFIVKFLPLGSTCGECDTGYQTYPNCDSCAAGYFDMGTTAINCAG